MRIALGLAGISYTPSHRENKPVDYRLSLENYRRQYWSYFSNDDIDVFIASYLNDFQSELINDYQPQEARFIPQIKNFLIGRKANLLNLLEMFQKRLLDYDIFILTRFDLIWKKSFTELGIDLTKLNNIGKLEDGVAIDDNFYLVPQSLMSKFIDAIRECCAKYDYLHWIVPELNYHVGKGNIHYLCDEQVRVAELSAFKIQRNDSSSPSNDLQ